MRQLEIGVIVPDHGVKEAYDILCNFERYPDHSPEVRSVVIESKNGERFSTWETAFRNGLLRSAPQRCSTPSTCEP